MNSIARDVVSLLPTLVENEKNQQLLTELLSEVEPRLRWEVGPFDDNLLYLAISPNFVGELLPLTASLVSSLPPVPGWVFLDAKPRKRWSPRRVTYHGREYCFQDWRYRLTSFKGGEFFDIDFFGCEEELPDATRDWLAVFVAASELGERLFMTAIDRVTVSPSSMVTGPTSAIEHLSRQVEGLLRA